LNKNNTETSLHGFFKLFFRKNAAFREDIKLMTFSKSRESFPFTLPGSLPQLGPSEPVLWDSK
jgi:hypothetical protein